MEDLIELGKTGIRISPLGLGTWQWGDFMVWGYGKSYNDSDLHGAFHASLSAGINFIDTAEVYGCWASTCTQPICRRLPRRWSSPRSSCRCHGG
jgi:aryl-alcohol dehydrogenase-like predicted oxidoreductase